MYCFLCSLACDHKMQIVSGEASLRCWTPLLLLFEQDTVVFLCIQFLVFDGLFSVREQVIGHVWIIIEAVGLYRV